MSTQSTEATVFNDNIVNQLSNPIYSFHSVLKTQLLKIISDFVRELDISFEYIDKSILKKIKKNINACENNDILFKQLHNDIFSSLNNYTEHFKVIEKQKVKTNEILFLNDIVLLNLNFELFKDEKKNTKKTLITYLSEFYNVSKFLNHINTNDSSENILSQIQKMVDELVIKPKEETSLTPSTSEKKSRSSKPQINMGNMMQNINNMSNNIDKNNPLFNQLNELIQNQDIMNIATELTSEMQSTDIDPMKIMSSLMSGNLQDTKINDLITSIGDKITKKLNNGEIDKNMLEEHANKFMNTMSSNKNDIMSMVTNMKM